MADQIVIAELDIDVDALEQKQADLFNSQQKLKADQKELQKAYKETGKLTDEQSKAYVRNDAALKNLNQQYQTNKKVLAESTTSINGLNDALNKEIKTEQQAKDNNRELIKARGQLDKTSKDYAKNVEVINSRIDENNEFLKDNGSALEKQRLNIGNYESALNNATGKLDQFIPGLGAATQATIAQARATQASNTGLKAFRAALVATGIGAIVVLLGSLVAAFLSTQEGIDKVTAVTRPFFAVLNKLKGLVQELASGAFAGLAQILNGDIREGLATIKNSFKDAVGGIGEAVQEGIKVGNELDKLSKQIEKTEINLIKNRARLNTEFEKFKSKAEDVTQTEAVRIKNAQLAQKAQDELLRQEQEFLDLKIKRLELEQTLNDTSREDEKELAELIAQRTQFEADATGKRVSVRNLENSIRQGIANEEKARAAERAKQLEEEVKLREKKVAKELELEKQKQEKLAEQARTAAEKQAAEDKLRQAIQFEEELARIEEKGLGKLALQQAQLNQEEQLQIQQAQREIENEELLQRKLTLIQEDFSNKRKQIDQIEEENKLQLKRQTFGNLATIFGEETVLGKAAAVAQTTIDTYQAAQAAFKAMAGIPVVGPVLGGIAAGAAVATGLRNVSRITGVGLPKFKKGGLQEVGGKSHEGGGTKFYGEDGTQFEAEKGELVGVMNRNAARMFMDFNNRNLNGGYYNPFADQVASRNSSSYMSDKNIVKGLGGLADTVRKKPVGYTNVDKNGFNQFITNGQNTQKYINKNFLN